MEGAKRGVGGMKGRRGGEHRSVTSVVSNIQSWGMLQRMQTQMHAKPG